jgi:hypothetical protein
MPRIVLVQVKRQRLHFKFYPYFCSVILQRFMRVDLARRRLDAGGFMVKMGSFVR